MTETVPRAGIRIASVLLLAAAAFGQAARPEAGRHPDLLALVAAVEEAEAQAVPAALLALGRSGDRGARPYLEAVLRDDHFARSWLRRPEPIPEAWRAAAALGLGHVGDPRSRSVLDGLAREPARTSRALHLAVCLGLGLASCHPDLPPSADSLARLVAVTRQDDVAAESRALLLLVLPLRYPNTPAAARLQTRADSASDPLARLLADPPDEPVVLVRRPRDPTRSFALAFLAHLDDADPTQRLAQARLLLEGAALRLTLHENSSRPLVRDDP